mgnify:CR=1 FL=1
MGEEFLECVCGAIIRSASEYRLVSTGDEVKVLCPNPSCPLGELGVVRLAQRSGSCELFKALFYPPYVTWNAARLGEEKALRLVEQHIEGIVRLVLEGAGEA